VDDRKIRPERTGRLPVPLEIADELRIFEKSRDEKKSAMEAAFKRISAIDSVRTFSCVILRM
jgi:hypothetical protein